MNNNKENNSNLYESLNLDCEWYSTTYPDVNMSGLSPLDHYNKIGRFLERKPSNQNNSTTNCTNSNKILYFDELTYNYNFEQKEIINLLKISVDNYKTKKEKITPIEKNHKNLLIKLKSKSILNNKKPQKRPLAIISTFNDEDIIEYIIKHALKNYDVYVIDNWSSDNTWELIKSIKHEGIVGIEQFPPTGPSSDYEWKKILTRKEEIASWFPDRWILHQDSDEITMTPINSVDAWRVFESVREMGYNVIPLRMLDFRPIDDSFTVGDPFTHFKYYEYTDITSYLMQNKVWYQKNSTPVDLSWNGGHEVAFEGSRVFPIRFPRLHYSIRSSSHKISKERNRIIRSKKEREELGWHAHLDVTLDNSFVRDKESLIEFNFEDLYNKYINKFLL
jgi:hypothetical protein